MQINASVQCSGLKHGRRLIVVRTGEKCIVILEMHSEYLFVWNQCNLVAGLLLRVASIASVTRYTMLYGRYSSDKSFKVTGIINSCDTLSS
ncbi:hypothetical protein D3C86_1147250 [compost metagenome]